jgi:hypothetical protein
LRRAREFAALVVMVALACVVRPLRTVGARVNDQGFRPGDGSANDSR